MNSVIAQPRNPCHGDESNMPGRQLRINSSMSVPPFLGLLEYILDPLLIVASLVLITHAYGIPFRGSYVVLTMITFLVSCVVFDQADVCRRWRYRGLWERSRRLLVSWLFLIGILLFLGYAAKYSEEFSRRVLLTWFLLTPFFILIGNAWVRRVVSRFYRSEKNTRSAVIAVANDASRKLAQSITQNPQLGMSVKGYFDDRSRDRLGGLEADRLLGCLDELPRYVANNKTDIIYIALPMTQQERVMKLLNELRDTTASVYFVPDIFFFDSIQARMGEINGIPVVSVCETPFSGMNGFLKRLFDLFFSIIALFLIAPLMLALAIGVKLSSPGPILFRQRRYGLDGEEIIVYKFRSMTVCEDGGQICQATRSDKRITPFGAFLRRTSLDELPQFINVLQGRMSVVGPRPHAVSHNETYRKLINGYMVRHKVKPGITGWAQVNGLRGETETLEKMKARVDHDLDYLKHWSMDMDIKIILKTILLVFKDRNAY